MVRVNAFWRLTILYLLHGLYVAFVVFASCACGVAEVYDDFEANSGSWPAPEGVSPNGKWVYQ